MNPWSRVFAIVPDCHASSGHYSNLWRLHFYEGLRQTVREVVTPSELDFSFAYEREIDPDFPAASRALVNIRLHDDILAAHRSGHLNAVFSYARSREIDPALVSEIVGRGIPWINFYCDSLGQFDAVQDLARVASLNWFPESAAVSKYRKMGRPILCRPYAVNLKALPPLSASPAIHPLGFIGMPTTNRATILSLLELLGCKCTIHGFGWDRSGQAAFPNTSPWPRKILQILIQPHRLERIWRALSWSKLQREAKGPLDDDDMRRFIAECRIVLGLNDARDENGALQSYLKFRDIEMPGLGCCYLTQDNADIHLAFEANKEVLTFRNIWEARDLIRFYNRNPDSAMRIGTAGRRRVIAEHTWKTRISEIQDMFR